MTASDRRRTGGHGTRRRGCSSHSGVLASEEAALEESVYSGLGVSPVHQAEEYRDMEVPEVLLGGNHRLIYLWKLEGGSAADRKRVRPDLFEDFLKKSGRIVKR